MILQETTPAAAQDIFTVVTLALNIVQTCFLAWLAAASRVARTSSTTPDPPHQ